MLKQQRGSKCVVAPLSRYWLIWSQSGLSRAAIMHGGCVARDSPAPGNSSSSSSSNHASSSSSSSRPAEPECFHESITPATGFFSNDSTLVASRHVPTRDMVHPRYSIPVPIDCPHLHLQFHTITPVTGFSSNDSMLSSRGTPTREIWSTSP